MTDLRFGPDELNIVATRGDTFGPLTLTVNANGDPAPTLTGAVAQLKRARSHTAAVELDLAPQVSGNEVEIPPVELTLDSGLYQWDIEVANADWPDGKTIVSGTFYVEPDTSEGAA